MSSPHGTRTNLCSAILIVLYLHVRGIYTEDIIRNSNVSSQCPTWYIPAENQVNKCICGDTIDGKLRCLQDDQVSVVVGNCMTFTDEQTVIGLCPYAIFNASLLKSLYTTVPKNVSDLDEFMCGWMNRTGLLCSQCKEGLSLAALSYRRECMECSNLGKGIIIFLSLAFIPTTVFFLIVMVCSVDIASGPMNAVLTLLQINLAEINRNPYNFIFKSANPLSYYPVLILLTFYGIWNLDFLRYVVPPFCISHSLTSLHTEALEYVVAVYPLLLIAVTYICVEMYDKDYQLVVAMWKPFRKISRSKCFKDLNVKYSLITTFATFLQLIYTRIFFISKNFLNYAYLKNSTGDTVSTVLVMDASIPFLSATHIPYVVLAIIMLIIFNLTPLLLLLLYPTKCFQLLLGRFPRVNWHPLHAFMDIFQGCYKNGTNGTRDYRYFAAFNFIIRILTLIPIDSHSIACIRLVIVPLIFSYMLAIMRPYQRNILNMWGIFGYFLYTINQLWLLCSTYDTHLSFELLYLSHFILSSYLCFVIVVKVVKTVSPGCYNACVERAKLCIGTTLNKNDTSPIWCCLKTWNKVDPEGGTMKNVNENHSCEVDDEFPDRVNNPQDYQPLLAQSGSGSAANIKHVIIASYGINNK